jgi:hypothetical protein
MFKMVDSVCVNQEDLNERSQQVRLMSRIYSKARQVVIWLGEAADDSDLLFNALEEMDSSFYMEDFRRYYVQGQKMLVENNAPRPLQDPHLVEALKKLFAHPWFIRVWVLQEVALASSVRVLCGSQDIPLDEIFAIQWARSASRTANSQIHKES